MSQLKPAEMDAVLDEHYKFEAMDDVDGVVSTLTEGVVHDVVGFPGGPLHGRAATRAFYQHLFADISGERTEPHIRAAVRSCTLPGSGPDTHRTSPSGLAMTCRFIPCRRCLPE